MRIIDLTKQNITIPLTNEEADILDMFEEHSVIQKSNLDERQQTIANQLVIKDLLTRSNNNGKITYKKRNY